MGLLALDVVFKKANRKSDDSVTLAFETQGEINTEQMSFIDGFRKTTGHLLFSKDAIKVADIPRGDTTAGAKTPSQELRSSLYAVWKAKTDRNLINEEWDSYYANAIMGFKRAVDKSHPDRNE